MITPNMDKKKGENSHKGTYHDTTWEVRALLNLGKHREGFPQWRGGQGRGLGQYWMGGGVRIELLKDGGYVVGEI